MTRRHVVTASVVCGATAIILTVPDLMAQVPPQARPPVFRSDVTLLPVDARVFDRDGRFVSTLTKADFEVLERGVRQPIESLELIGHREPRAAVDTRPPLPRGGATDPQW